MNDVVDYSTIPVSDIIENNKATPLEWECLLVDKNKGIMQFITKKYVGVIFQMKNLTFSEDSDIASGEYTLLGDIPDELTEEDAQYVFEIIINDMLQEFVDSNDITQ